ncbi:efflux RND transporter periplasmic adaptor subunit [Pseudomonas lijiangensis]|uniref:efflux RND transporter periplasmic adaptor subunit n=1 Tax=Pseudomonas lijiangensis TaxID=2995658 RepID=UPI0031BB9777
MNTLSFISALCNRKSLLAVFLLASAVSGGLFFVSEHSMATQPLGQPAVALTVTVALATQARWPVTLEASGVIAPWQEAVISSQVSGLRLDEILVNVGDHVRRGQLLATFDSELLETDKARLKASWEQAEVNRQRALKLKGTGSLSEQEVLQYLTQADVAKALLQSTLLQLRYARVTAPDDGVISARNATLGIVSASGQELFRMIRQSRLEWRGEMTAIQLSGIKPGQRVDLTLPDDTCATALVRQIAPSLDSQARLGIVYADIEPGSGARAGMYPLGRVTLTESPAVIVPAGSVAVRDGRSYVPTLPAGDRVSLQAVTLGRRQGAEVEITSGLRIGDKVVVQGAGFLNEGDRVHVVAAPDVTKE